MTPTLWWLLYGQLTFILTAIAFGWSSGLEQRAQDERTDRMHREIAANVARGEAWAAERAAARRRFVQKSRNAALLRHNTERRL